MIPQAVGQFSWARSIIKIDRNQETSFIFDHLMGVSEICLSFKFFKRNRFFIQRMNRDKREMTVLVAKMSRTKASKVEKYRVVGKI